MADETAPKRPFAATLSLVLCVAILVGGGLGMMGLLALREPPAMADLPERELRVEVATVQLENVPVVMTGFGEAKAIDEVAVVPQVSGRIVETHPRLKAGEVIPKGEPLFRIDPSDYEASLQRAEATVDQLKNSLAALHKQKAMDTDMLTTLKRTLDLSQTEMGRLKKLYETDEVGTLSGVERAEMGFNQSKATHDQLAHAVELYPNRIGEAESGLAAAEAAVQLARNALERTTISFGFDARVKMENIEIGQVVAPGAPVAQVANDSELEIRVPLDSRDARQWLQFEGTGGDNEGAWFNDTTPVICNIRWSEDPESHVWEGTLQRVEAFDPQTRTLAVVVRVQGDQARSRDEARLPLVDGMFCNVDIPGKSMPSVYRVPRWAVSFEGDLYIAKDNRLEVRRVKVVRQQGEESYVSEGLEPGDQIIVTRLVNPAPNSKLQIVEPEPEDVGAAADGATKAAAS